MEDELKNLADSYRDLESQRENLIDELARLTNESLEKLNRSRAKMKSFDVSSYLKKTKVESFMASIKEDQLGNKTISQEPSQKVQHKAEKSPDSGSPSKGEEQETNSQSFFDNI
jgi:cell division initiation protein